MAKVSYPSAKQDQFVVRFPDGLRDRVRRAAEKSSRSMNSEIIATLEKAYPDEEEQLRAAIDELRAAINKAPEHVRKQMLDKLDSIDKGVLAGIFG